jgi:FlaA1/EpsC-like NDP-sugar epimerase
LLLCAKQRGYPLSERENIASGTENLADPQPTGRLRLGRTLFVYGTEIFAILCAAVFAFLLRFDFSLPPSYVPVLLKAVVVWVPAKILVFKLLGLDRRWARYVSLSDLNLVAASNLIGSIISLVVLLVLGRGVPRSIYAIDFLLCLMLTCGIRVAVRTAYENLRVRPSGSRKRTIIYGAGNAGAALVRDLRQNAVSKYDPCGFVDDSPQKLGLVLHGVKVYGAGDRLAEICNDRSAELVLIAIPSLSGMQLTRILESCTLAGIPYKTIPGLDEILEDSALSRQIRDVAVEDLLGRHPVVLDQSSLEGQLTGRVIMVTGAAGSIGSEICRQLARFRPKAIVGFEIAESALFNLQLEMARRYPSITFEAEIGSIQNRARLRDVFAKHRPHAVYHAAAYKHVPLMEAHMFEAVENNVFGTLNLVETAREFNVQEFVMISTDKAVRPTNIMGSTKRIAEILVRALQPEGARYVSVRFGNVLGSNGSVIPIFKEQISRGGPVTVTHPDMRRYFMTIPEACQLVLQASTMGRGGEIFVLDMGEPVKIADLARNLILLSGLRPNVDIQIEFSGQRPGEKLFEELNAEGEDFVPTHHEKIKIFAGGTQPWHEVERNLDWLRDHCVQRSCSELVALIRQVVPDYSPSARLLSDSNASGK